MDISSNCTETLRITRQGGREGQETTGISAVSTISALDVPKGTKCNMKTDCVQLRFPKLGQCSEQKFLAWQINVNNIVSKYWKK